MRSPRRTTYTRIKTYPNGKRVKLVISENGRILEKIPVGGGGKVRRTRTGKRLNRIRRKLGL